MTDQPDPNVRHDIGGWISGPMADPPSGGIPDTLNSVISDLAMIRAEMPVPADRLDVVVRMLRELAGQIEDVASMLRGERWGSD